MAQSRVVPLRQSRPLSALGFDILGVAYLFLALSVMLALVSRSYSMNWIGPVGDAAARLLAFALGQWVVFFIPVLFVLFALNAFRGKMFSISRPLIRAFGSALLIGCLCALSTLVVAQRSTDLSRQFHAGGALGAFLTAPEGLGVARLLGPVGASLLFAALLVASLVLLTQFLLRDIMGAGARAMRQAYAASQSSSLFASLGRAVSPAAAKPAGRGAGRTSAPAPSETLWSRFIRFAMNPLRGLLFPHRTEKALPPMSPSKPRIIDRSSGGPGVELSDADEDGEADLAPKPATRARRKPKTREIEGLFDTAAAPAARQTELELFPSDYELPSLQLLNPTPKSEFKISHDEILQTSAHLEQTLREFGVDAAVNQVVQGPVVTRFELQPAAGVKVNRISGLEREIAMALLAEHVRIQAPIPGKPAVGVEIPNKKTNPVFLREILASEAFQTHPSPLAFGLGKDISGEPIVCDLADMPHLLIAGATGAGKSVCLNAIVISILMRMPPDRVRFIMVDPKRVELTHYQGIPHLLAPVVNNPRKAAGALSWVVEQMEMRYRQLEQLHVRNIASYNTTLADAYEGGGRRDGDPVPMPYIVVIVDELADLMLVARNEVEESIQRLAQMSRAVGIHLILATQRPSVNVITGVIKANLPTRVAFRVSSMVDSRTIIDSKGAESLLGRGDMLYSPGGGRLYRVQGGFVSDAEVERVADMIREQGPANYAREDFAAARPAKRRGAPAEEGDGETTSPAARTEFGDDVPFDSGDMMDDELYLKAIKLVMEAKQASVSLIQRRLKIGYARAGRLMDMMEEGGLVGPYQGSKPRDILVNPEEHLARLQEEGLISREEF